jgi:hypothetical protein
VVAAAGAPAPAAEGAAGGSGWLCTGATGAAVGGSDGSAWASAGAVGRGAGVAAVAASSEYCGFGMVSGGGPRVSSALVG